MNNLIFKAKSHVLCGELDAAKSLYLNYLSIYPNNRRIKEALSKLPKEVTDDHQLSLRCNKLINLFNEGYFKEVIDSAQLLAKKHPKAFMVWNILGAAYNEISKFKQAENCFQKALELSPNNVKVYYNLGITINRQGRLEEAIKIYRKVIHLDPNFVDAYNSMGNAFKDQGKIEESKVSYIRALELDPKYFEGYLSLGNLFFHQRKLDEAVQMYKQAIHFNPYYVEAYNNMGSVLKEKGKLKEAIVAYKKAIEIKFNYSEAYNNLGVVLKLDCKIDEAVQMYKQAIHFNPDYFEAYNNMGNLFRESGKVSLALDCYNKSLTINPNCAETFNCLGNVHKDNNEIVKAIKAYEKAIKLDSEFSEYAYNFGLMHLKIKDWKCGWKYYENRWNLKNFKEEKIMSQKPLWQGDFAKNLFVWAEQGVGDEVMFSSVIPQVKKSCNDLYVSCDERLFDLFKRSFDSNIKLVKKGFSLDQSYYDYQVSAGTAFGYFRLTSDSFSKNDKPYLKCDDNLCAKIQKKLKAKAKGSRIIGVSWFTESKNDGEKRSLSLSKLVDALPDNILLVDLQYKSSLIDNNEQIYTIGKKFADLGKIDNFNDIETFAALIQACDLIVSIDNSTVHFAGALGKECHVLLPYSHMSDWRWGIHGSKQSDYYSKVFLHWQSEPNDWKGCLSSLKSAF